MIDELLAEINELKEIKRKYESALKGKQIMSDLLYELLSEKYNHMDYEKRVEWHKDNQCSHCRYRYDCIIELKEDIGIVVPSDKARIPPRITCDKFDWS